MALSTILWGIVIYILTFPIKKRLYVLSCKYNRRIHKIKGEYYTYNLINEEGAYNKSSSSDYQFFRLFSYIPLLQQINCTIALIAYIYYFIYYIKVSISNKLKLSNSNLFIFGINFKSILKFISKFSTFKPE